MRKLASIQEVVDIQPIKGADRIEVVTVLGWKCVTKKGEFSIGEKVVYVEVDSVMPDNGNYEFLRERKFRVRTIKLKKQISQGLVLPLSVFDSLSPKVSSGFMNINDDVTDYLGITKYLSPTDLQDIANEERRIRDDKNKLRKFMMRYSWFRRLFLSRTKKSGFPYWVQKTDETRIQSSPQIIDQFKDAYVTITEKIDYQSGTWTSKRVPRFNGVFSFLPFKKTLFVVASRNLTNNDKAGLYWQIADKYKLKELCEKFPGIIIQGEQGNSKIQGNKYKITEPKMWVFNIIKDGRFLDYRDMERFCLDHNLDYVPIVAEGKMSDLFTNVEDAVKFSEGKSLINKDVNREGVVVRFINNSTGKKELSFKIINPKFLLKYDE